MTKLTNNLLILGGKTLSLAITVLNLGNGSTWPGHIALNVNKDFIKQMLQNSEAKVIMIAGTNGKTTTTKLIKTILQENGKKVIENASGANLMNGLASTLLLRSNSQGKIEADYLLFEVDENALPAVLREITPDYLLLLNLFRDQLDRYGEVDTIAEKWQKVLKDLPKSTTIIANADDPRTAFLAENSGAKSLFFGLDDPKRKMKEHEHAVDSVYCPRCGTRLDYKTIYYSHLGDWKCPHCGLQRPKMVLSNYTYLPLSGTYNLYNTLAAVAISRECSTSEDMIAKALKNFVPAFGRQEKIEAKNRQIQLFLAKNPTGFNESLRTIHELKAKNVLFILNDQIADGTDVSWIWDFDLEDVISSFKHITIAGDRVYDMALRVKYTSDQQMANGEWHIEEKLEKAIDKALEITPSGETLYILPTYTAMLDVREILTGKKIL